MHHLVGYINSLDRFAFRIWGNEIVEADNLTRRVLTLAIPDVSLTPLQMAELARAQSYAASLNIIIEIVRIP
jgi:hypothetical protein